MDGLYYKNSFNVILCDKSGVLRILFRKMCAI